MNAARRVRTAVVLAVLVGLGWSGYLWGRDLSLFRVRHVTIEGLDGRETPSIRRALRETALRMTTLHVRRDELERAVDSFAVVRSVSASADFPNTLRIEVSEHVPVAALTAPDGRRVAVSGANTLLRALGPNAKLPIVSVESIPTSGTVDGDDARRLVGVLARAPAALRPLLVRASQSATGIRIPIRGGPVLQFGSADRSAAKWAAVARVLADPAAKGARFIDVRLPGRPVAGGFPAGAGSTGA